MPDRPPSLFAGSPLLLMGRYRGRPQGTVRGARQDTATAAPWREAIVPGVRDNPAIAAAWARGQVRQLEDRYAAGLGDRSALEQTIITTSLRFGVLCRFTAYVAVDRAAVVNEGGEVHQITQPVEMPAGWGVDDEVCDAACLPAPWVVPHEDDCRTMASACSPPSPIAMKAEMDMELFELTSPARLPRLALPPLSTSRASAAAFDRRRAIPKGGN